jgi:DNA end-binding protein Ku
MGPPFFHGHLARSVYETSNASARHGHAAAHPYQVHAASAYFDDIQDVKITKDMLGLAKHIVGEKSGQFEPGKFEDHYEAALAQLVEKKQKGVPLSAAKTPAPSHVVTSWMLCALVSARRARQPSGKRTKAPAKKAAKSKKSA